MEYLQKAFDKKYVFCGDYCYLKEYSKPHLLGVKRSENAVKGKDNESGKLKRYDNLKRARDSVAQIVYSNLTPYTKFLTLTTSETVLEIPEFQRKLQTFLQQMKRNGFKLKYIYVYERQLERGKKEGNKGCLHVHMIVFNDEYIPMDIIKKCWHYGRVELKILNGLRCKDNKQTQELIRNPARYICKYITKYLDVAKILKDLLKSIMKFMCIRIALVLQLIAKSFRDFSTIFILYSMKMLKRYDIPLTEKQNNIFNQCLLEERKRKNE